MMKHKDEDQEPLVRSCKMDRTFLDQIDRLTRDMMCRVLFKNRRCVRWGFR